MSTTQRSLTLLRHAQAAAAPRGQHDFERPLDATGQAQLRERAPAFANATSSFPIDRCLHSSAVRTTATALAFAHACGLPKSAIYAEADLYEVDLPTLLAVLRRTPETVQHLLLVGHNPTLSALAWQLSPAASPGGLQPCDLVTVTFTGPWAELR
ncbi:MAG: hypothetical protein RJB26_1134 [Pseudomonadota bacterium]